MSISFSGYGMIPHCVTISLSDMDPVKRADEKKSHHHGGHRQLAILGCLCFCSLKTSGFAIPVMLAFQVSALYNLILQMWMGSLLCRFLACFVQWHLCEAKSVFHLIHQWIQELKIFLAVCIFILNIKEKFLRSSLLRSFIKTNSN